MQRLTQLPTTFFPFIFTGCVVLIQYIFVYAAPDMCEISKNFPGIVKSPLDQFEIRNLLSLDAPILANLHISLTNIGLYLTITASIALVLNLLATNYNKVIANS